MSKSKNIAEHEQALSAYFQDMLTENTEAQTDQNNANFSSDESWRHSPFQALLVDIQGLQLAIPQHQLKNIQLTPQVNEQTKTNTTSWHIGTQGYLKIVDTGKIILPLDYQDENNHSDFMIIISDNKWALACNKINKVITLSPSAVKWRQQPGNRPWLAGTTLEHKCGILDIDGLIKQLELETVN